MQPHILSIGYGRHLFEKENGERARQQACAAHVASLHMIVFSTRAHTLTQEVVSQNFTLYPTNSFFKGGMIIDAFWMGLQIMRSQPRGTAWCITTQDPLGAGLVGFLLRWVTHCPLVVQEHGDIFSGDYWKNETRGNHFWYRVGTFILRRADRVRVVSARVREHVEALGVETARIAVLPVYTDVRGLLQKNPVTNLRTLYPTAECIVLSVARFVPQKNLLLLLHAFARLWARNQRAHLVLVGKGPQETLLRTEIETLRLHDAVTILPWSDDIASLMKTADIYALSSNYEGWGRVLIEAMACGLPVVTTSVGCAGEVCKDAVHGLVVPVGDEKAFGDALVALSGNRERRIVFAQNGTRDAEKVFTDIESYARAWAEVLGGET